MPKIRHVVALGLLWALPLQAQQFGAYSASRDGEILIAEPVKQNDPATIYRFRQSANGWQEVGTLMAPAHDGGDYFGRFIAMDDQSLLIGGTVVDSSTGAVWVYRRNGTEWQFVERLRPDDVETGDSFGRFGVLSGDHL